MIDRTVGRRRAAEAMGFGPLWVRRTPRSTALVDGPVVSAEDDLPTKADADDRAALIGTMDWDTLSAAVTGCRACGLSRTRRHAVVGSGPRRAEWLLIAGGPAADDDASGEAFVGSPGRLFDAMLSAVGLGRDRGAYATHVVKCRPPDDRSPSNAEVACCRPYLDRQVALLQPRLIVALGERASRALTGESLDAARGRPAPIRLAEREIATVVTDDPADLLAAPAGKAQVWADLCLAREVPPDTPTNGID